MTEPNIETTLERLEQIVTQLESDELDLETALQLFEEGVKLSDAVQKKLKQGELRIRRVLENAEGFSLEDFSL